LVRTIKNHGKRIKVLEQRVNDARSKLANSRGIQGSITAAQMTALALLSTSQINALASISAAQLTDLQLLSTSQITAMNSITASQYTLLGTTNLTFIASLGILPNQSDNNTTLSGVLTWSNNITDHLISNGYMSP